ncbi:D-glycerate 2-kinase [subsurface metagenome]
MIIKNKDTLATTKLRKQALDIIEVGITRVLPPNIMKSAVRYDTAGRILTINGDTYRLSTGRVFVIGGGKASGLMAETLENIIHPENISAGVVNCKSGYYKTSKIKIIPAGHPLPDRRGIEGVKKILALREHYSINENDLVICLISGGGSALMPYPVNEVSLRDKQIITELLLSSGAEIDEINAVRKHLSQIKGGWLGHFYSPATVVSLILSDVIGNNLAAIASGPTFPDPTTFSDAYNVLKRYDLLAKAPKSVTDFLRKGCQGEVAETPKTLNNCHNYIIGDNKLALEAMLQKANEMGLKPYIVTAEQKGDTTAVAHSRAREILSSRYAGYDAILIGGETTPKLPVTAGRGGRNQHYAAVSMLAMKQYAGQWVVASVGTDGSDFLPDVAGAIVDNNSLDIAKAKGIDVQSYLERYDSNTLLDKIGGSLVITGDTGTNVGDVIIYLLK